MKVLDSLLEAYHDRTDEFKKYISKAYKYVAANRDNTTHELVTKNSYKVTVVLKNGLSYSVKRKDIKEAEWICWYKLIEILAISAHWFKYKYNSDLLTFTLLTYMVNDKPVDYAKRIGFHKPKFVNRYEKTNKPKLKKNTQPSLF